MIGFLRLNRSNPSPVAGDAPEAEAVMETPPPAESVDAQAAPGPARPIYVARQPIFDRQSKAVGYELLFRKGPENRFDGADVEAASAIGIENSATAFGLDELVGDRLAYVNLSRGALLKEFYRLLPPERTVIELLESVEPDRAVVDACLRLRAAGYKLALDDFTDAPAARPLLAIADLVKVDLRAAPTRCDASMIQRLRNRRIGLLAEKVETQDEHAAAMKAGYDFFQGYYYCHPQMIETRDLPPTKITQLRFLAEVSREDASFERLEELFLQDVGLTLRLLRYLNSAAFGWRHEIVSLRHALMLMGLRPLKKWAMMMGMMNLSEDRPRELTVTALSRARFAEQIGPPAGLVSQDHELFLTGMLSLADAIVGRPIREIVDGLALPTAVRAALTEGGNTIASVLRMVSAYQRGDWVTVDAASAETAVDYGVLDQAYVSSLEWAEAVART